ncbi:putative 1,2-alpha-mannosidase [Neohortaea acidophila]|uniref:alpha-1,2-Mannosidase n=1 Tax=Neohortaea acidophila TaxID=245834 RepID=A0A6A6PMW5_9PEZI|nr:putative 1,2-alpha-mannosidase [Neohortaea acidophila]KAF2480783.1 putative 1,2-alpha-mannosidase [Neohortaea acidophila]
MSSYAPPSQNGWPTQRHFDAQPGPSSHSTLPGHSRGNGSIGAKVSGLFAPDRSQELPMYKDKPTSYWAKTGGPRARAPWMLQRRTVAVALTTLALLSWWFGILSPLHWFAGDGRKPPSAKTWAARAEQVRDTFKISFAGYEANAWGFDEYHPVSKSGRQMTQTGLGWIIVDALDTMMLMNLTTEVAHARQWIHDHLDYDQDHDVNTFESTIRMLGGLLSAHYLTTEFKGLYAPVHDGLSDDMYIEKATDLADRLLGAYTSNSGVPYASVNLHTRQGIPSHTDGGASSTAEATSVQLEMKYLAKLTGEDLFWEKSEAVMKVIDDNNPQAGLVPIFISADRGTFVGDNVRLGSRGDSYYEYLIKQYFQTSKEEPVYQAMWNDSLAGIKDHLITYSYPSNFTLIAERPSGLGGGPSAKMDHLVCFMPGTLALATTGGLTLAEARKQPTWTQQQEDDMRLAEELTNTCWGMYMATDTGLAGEITHFHLHSPPLMYNDFNARPELRPHCPPDFDKIYPGHDFAGRDDYIIKGMDAHNLQRPETVESLFYMWRITGDQKYREWGWKMFQNFVRWTDVGDGSGYSSLNSVLQKPPTFRDNMESFWLAETLKYFYLLFSSNDILPLTDVVFNTEAHPFPRFHLGKLFKTGWQRKARDSNGNFIPEAQQGATEVTTVTQTLEKEPGVTATTTVEIAGLATPPAV